MISTNRIIRPFIALLTVGLLAALLIPLATRSSRAAQPTAAGTPSVTGFSGVKEGQAVTGKAAIEAIVSGTKIARVVFQLDGPKPATKTDRNKPYFFMGDSNGVPNGWDTTKYPNGAYTLTATAINSGGQRGALAIRFSIANNTQPQPTATQTPVPTATSRLRLPRHPEMSRRSRASPARPGYTTATRPPARTASNTRHGTRRSIRSMVATSATSTVTTRAPRCYSTKSACRPSAMSTRSRVNAKKIISATRFLSSTTIHAAAACW